MVREASTTALADTDRPSEWPWLLSQPFPIRSVVRRWRSLTGIVVGVGIALAVNMAILGLVSTAIGLVLGDFNRSGVNLFITVSGGKLVPLDPGDSPGSIEQASAVLSRVRGLPGVRAAIGQVTWSLRHDPEGRRPRDEPAQFLPVVGVDGDPADLSGFLALERGRWLRSGNEVVVGRTLATAKSLDVGSLVRLNGLDFEVVGVGRLRGVGTANDSVLYLDIRTLRRQTSVGNTVNYIAVQADNPDAVKSSIADLTSLRAVSPAQLLEETTATPSYQSGIAFYWIIGLFVLSVAGMFVSNLLGRSVAERRLEFGTMRAIGVPKRTILLCVATEALFICLAAYVFGFILSVLLGEAMNIWLAPVLRFERLFSIDIVTDLQILVLTLALGLVAGWFPARRAMNVDPLEVLREA